MPQLSAVHICTERTPQPSAHPAAATWESDGTWGLVADTSNDRIRKLVVATDPEPEPEPEPEPVQCKESDPCFYQSAAVGCKAARL